MSPGFPGRGRGGGAGKGPCAYVLSCEPTGTSSKGRMAQSPLFGRDGGAWGRRRRKRWGGNIRRTMPVLPEHQLNSTLDTQMPFQIFSTDGRGRRTGAIDLQPPSAGKGVAVSSHAPFGDRPLEPPRSPTSPRTAVMTQHTGDDRSMKPSTSADVIVSTTSWAEAATRIRLASGHLERMCLTASPAEPSENVGSSTTMWGCELTS